MFVTILIVVLVAQVIQYHLADPVNGETNNDHPSNKLSLNEIIGEYGTFFRGNSSDYGYSVAVDSNDNIIMVGLTLSDDFPVSEDAHDQTLDGVNSSDCFISVFAPDGVLLWSTYLGGNDGDHGRAVAVDSHDNIVITGWTYSSDFPVSEDAYDQTFNTVADCFVSILSSNGVLEWSTYLGGTQQNAGNAIAVDSHDNIIIFGWTFSTDFPVSEDAYDQTSCRHHDCYLFIFYRSNLSDNTDTTIGFSFFGVIFFFGVITFLRYLLINNRRK